MAPEEGEKIDDRQFGFRKQISTLDTISKINNKNGFKRKEKTVEIFYDIEKAYNKINRNKTLKQLEKTGIND